MENLHGIVNYYIEGIMKEYRITDRHRAEAILASALQNDKTDIVITELIESQIEK